MTPERYQRRLRWLIRRMCYDDALLFANWCAVEYVYLERGLPQYRIYYADVLIGVLHVRHSARLVFVHEALVDALTGLRCDPFTAALVEGAALTPMNARVRDLPVLRLPAKSMVRAG